MSKVNASLHSKKQDALARFQSGRLVEAGSLYDEIRKKNPRDADAWFMLGIIHGQLGSLTQAEACSRQATSLAPASYPAWDNLGVALMLQGKYAEAKNCFLRSLQINPRDEQAHNNLGTLLRDEGKLDEAMLHHRRAIELKPDYAEAHNNLGNILHDRSQIREALACYEQAIRYAPGYIDALFNRGMAQQKMGQYQAALESYRFVLSLSPNHHDAMAGIANLYEKQGQYQAAYDALKPMADNGSLSAPGATTFAAAARRLGRHDEAITVMEKLVTLAELSLERKQELHFSLGDLYDETGNYDQAFAHFQKGNTLRPYPPDPDSHQDYFARLIEAFSPESMPRLARATNSSQRPVFIVGMPRSGTTLVEQILSSHPQVHGAGELRDIDDLTTAIGALTNSSTPYPACIADLSSMQLDILAQRYLDHLMELSSKAARVTDKMPHNFLNLGFIALLFPKARVIHCTREPLDSCLSIYFHNFNANHPYSSDLASLGKYYRQYQRLMSHWKTTLDISCHEIRYEDLVANQESATRDLLDFCELPWDPACLRFYESNRIVTTPSYQQVRRPMYRTSVQRWKNYQSHIKPLMEALAGNN